MSTLVADPPVRLRPDGEGVQLTPFGVVPLGEARIDSGMMGSAMPDPAPALARPMPIAAPEPALERSVPKARPMLGSSPGDVLKAARARIKELRAFMREAAKAKKELVELERLVAAAKGKPLATVRDLRRSAG